MWKWALVPFLVVAVYTDWRWHRLFNWLTFPALGIGLILSGVWGGWSGLLSSLAGAGIAFGVFLVLYLVARMGAGDLKLMVAIGAWLGYPAIIPDLVYVMLAGGVIALGFALRYGALGSVFRNLYYFLLSLFTPGVKPENVLAASALPPFPYGVAIALGTLYTLGTLFLPRLPALHGG